VEDCSCMVVHDRLLVQGFISEFHSTLGAPVGWRVAFALLFGGEVLGISTWGRPTARLEDQVATLEHTRMALKPSAPKNSGSWFLARNREWIRENMPGIIRLIAYVNLDDHNGGIYRADNWKQLYRKKNRSSWTNRAGRLGTEVTIRGKFEREP
jgi:hypothetical protein